MDPCFNLSASVGAFDCTAAMVSNDQNDLLAALANFVAVNNFAQLDASLANLSATLENLDTDSARLAAAYQTFAEQAAVQNAAFDSQNSELTHQANALRQQTEYSQKQLNHSTVLKDAHTAQGHACKEIIEEIEAMNEDELESHVLVLLEGLEEATRSLESGTIAQICQILRGSPENAKRDKTIAIVASLVALVGTGALLFASGTTAAVGHFGFGCALPGFQYAWRAQTKPLDPEKATWKEVEARKKAIFNWVDFAKHVVVGGAVHLTVKQFVTPIFAKLGAQFQAAKAVATPTFGPAACKVTNFSLELIGKTISQSVINASEMLLRKKLMGQEINAAEVFIAIVSGSVGAAFSFGVDKAADEITDVVFRLFGKGIAGFVNSASARVIDNKLHKKKWSDGALSAGAEGFLWTLLFQAADEVKQYRQNMEELEKIKEAVCDVLCDKMSSKNISQYIQRIKNAKSLDEINDILKEAEIDLAIEQLSADRSISEEDRTNMIRELRNPNRDLSNIIRKVYLDKAQQLELPDNIKNGLLDELRSAKYPRDLAKAMENALKKLSNEISKGNLDLKNWEEARTTIYCWVSNLVKDGYHPTGDHRNQKYWQTEEGKQKLTDMIMCSLETGKPVYMTHHHHFSHIELKDDRSLHCYKYEKKNICKPDKWDQEKKYLQRDLVKPKYDENKLNEFRANYRSLENSKEMCQKIVDVLDKVYSNHRIDFAFNSLRLEFLSKLSPLQLQKVFTMIMNRVQNKRIPLEKLNVFKDGWIPTSDKETLKKDKNKKPKVRVNPVSLTPPQFPQVAIQQVHVPAVAIQPITAPVFALIQAPVLLTALMTRPQFSYIARLVLNLGAQLDEERVLHSTRFTRPNFSYVTNLSLRLKTRLENEVVRPLCVPVYAVCRNETIARLKYQVAHCATGKRGRMKKRSLQLQLDLQKNP